MSTTTLLVKYRPLRVGFLVCHGDFESLARIAGVNSLICGGIFNPIIPILNGDELPSGLPSLFNVDVLVPVSRDPSLLAPILDRYPYLRTFERLIDNIFFLDWYKKKHNIALLDILHNIHHHWESHFKHRSADYRSNFVIANWSTEDPCATVFALLFGHFSDDDRLVDSFRNAFEAGLRCQVIKIEDGDVEPQLANLTTPLHFTADRLVRRREPFPLVGGVYIGQSNDFDDLVTFWNLRATGASLTFLPADHKSRFQQFVQATLDTLARRTSADPFPPGFLGVFHAEGRSTIARDVMAGFHCNQTLVPTPLSRSSSLQQGPRPCSIHLLRDSVLAHIDLRGERYAVSFALPPMDTFVSEDRRNTQFQHLAAVIEAGSESDYPGHTLVPPLLPELSEFVSREMAFIPRKLRIDEEGIALIHSVSDKFQTLHPVRHTDLIIKMFDLAGLHAATSHAGLIADRITRSMGGSMFFDCRVFKIGGVRRLIRELGRVERISWNDGLETIGRQGFDRHKHLYIEERRTAALTPADVFNFLLKKKVIRPRLKFFNHLLRRKKEFRCRSCGLKSRVLLQNFEGRWQCSLCDHQHFLPEFIGEEFSGARSDWVFERGGLFAKDNKQEGALPVILTLWQFQRINGMTKSFYSTALNLRFQNDKACEVDFVATQYGQGGLIEMAIGECKDEGGRIDTQDVANLLEVRKTLEKIGVTCYLVFSKTAEAFREDELALFGRLLREGIVPILFTNKELEPYEPYEEQRDRKLPEGFAFTFDGMARNSEFLYLANQSNSNGASPDSRWSRIR